MSDENVNEQNVDERIERMLEAARGGLTPHEALIQASLAEAADVDGRAAAIARNRERAMRLLAALEKKDS